MHDITEHHTKEEWERNCSKNSWIHLFVIGDTVSVDNILWHFCETIQIEKGWPLKSDIFWTSFNCNA